MSSERRILEQWAKQNPGLFGGLKQAISGAEGTILGGKPGYNVMFGGGKFNDLSRHPDRVISSRGGYSSAAAGAYQFMPGTWGEVKSKLGLTDFGPQSQDLGMLQKVRQRLMPIGGLAAITKAGALTPEIQAALAPEWASFPTQSGSSYYGQPVKKAAQIQQFFEQGRTRSQNVAAPATAPASTPVATESPSAKGNALGSGLLRQIMGMIPAMRQRQSSLPGMLDSYLGDVNSPRVPVPADFLQLFMDKEVTG
jgi:muramidase (phage lysozyme)